MINPLIQTIVFNLDKNTPHYTHLECTITNSDEGMAVLNVVRRNKYLTSCDIKIDAPNEELRHLSLIKQAITFKIDERRFGQGLLAEKFKLFGKSQVMKNECCNQTAVLTETKTL